MRRRALPPCWRLPRFWWGRHAANWGRDHQRLRYLTSSTRSSLQRPYIMAASTAPWLSSPCCHWMSGAAAAYPMWCLTLVRRAPHACMHHPCCDPGRGGESQAIAFAHSIVLHFSTHLPHFGSPTSIDEFSSRRRSPLGCRHRYEHSSSPG